MGLGRGQPGLGRLRRQPGLEAAARGEGPDLDQPLDPRVLGPRQLEGVAGLGHRELEGGAVVGVLAARDELGQGVAATHEGPDRPGRQVGGEAARHRGRHLGLAAGAGPDLGRDVEAVGHRSATGRRRGEVERPLLLLEEGDGAVLLLGLGRQRRRLGRRQHPDLAEIVAVDHRRRVEQQLEPGAAGGGRGDVDPEDAGATGRVDLELLDPRAGQAHRRASLAQRLERGEVGEVDGEAARGPRDQRRELDEQLATVGPLAHHDRRRLHRRRQLRRRRGPAPQQHQRRRQRRRRPARRVPGVPHGVISRRRDR